MDRFGWNATLASEPDPPGWVLERGDDAFQDESVARKNHAEAGVEQVLAVCDNGILVHLAAGAPSVKHGVVVLKAKDRWRLARSRHIAWDDNATHLQLCQFREHVALFSRAFGQAHRGRD